MKNSNGLFIYIYFPLKVFSVGVLLRVFGWWETVKLVQAVKRGQAGALVCRQVQGFKGTLHMRVRLRYSGFS